jgi:16S rRNA C967 or C1407 C5-methylase (RsmB/RsmF family)/NOL1/NOP2/fmu family ribosome biogenesis protein
MLPVAFQAQIRAKLGDEEATLFFEALETPPSVSIRYNPRKKNAFFSSENFVPVPWCADAFYLSERPSFTLDPVFHAGAYYVQEASSMFVAEALKQSIDLDKTLNALDLCAAPGGKTTLLASLLNDESLLLANEVIKSRVGVLKENMTKWGTPNVVVSNHDSEDFAELEGFFDVILIDAPCSGEGLFRKDLQARQEWSPENVQTCTARQKRILANTVKLLAPNGVLLYSTCTYNELENKENVEWLIQTTDLEQVTLNLPSEWGITEYSYGYQFYPHKLRGEGFFISVLKKESVGGEREKESVGESKRSREKESVWGDRESIGEDKERKKGKKATRGKEQEKEKTFKNMLAATKKQIDVIVPWIEASERFDYFVKPNNEIVAVLKTQVETLLLLDKVLQRKGLGLEIGEIKGNDFIPAHALALSTVLSSQIPFIEVAKLEALLFLKKEDFALETTQKGWAIVRHQGQNLGWVKLLGNRLNNYLPKEWRIRMAL